MKKIREFKKILCLLLGASMVLSGGQRGLARTTEPVFGDEDDTDSSYGNRSSGSRSTENYLTDTQINELKTFDSDLKVKKADASSVRLSFKVSPYADRYELMRSEGTDGKFETVYSGDIKDTDKYSDYSSITNTDSDEKFTYKDKNVKLGEAYSYKLVSYYDTRVLQYSMSTFAPAKTPVPSASPASGSGVHYYSGSGSSYPGYSGYGYTTPAPFRVLYGSKPGKNLKKAGDSYSGYPYYFYYTPEPSDKPDYPSDTPGTSFDPYYPVNTPEPSSYPHYPGETSEPPRPTYYGGSTQAPAQTPSARPVYVATKGTVETKKVAGYILPESSRVKKVKVVKNHVWKISWKKKNFAEGYVLYRANEKGKYKKLGKFGSGKGSVKIKKVKHGASGYFYVAPYIKPGSEFKKVLSNAESRDSYDAAGSLVSGNVKPENGGYNGDILAAPCKKECYGVMNYYSCDAESYEMRQARIFGKSNKTSYSSAAEASKHMTSFPVKTWDLKGGKKVTRTWHLTMNKKIAPSVKKIFKEIYKGKTKFPIHSLGGFSYRPGQHGVGLAMDINPDENYQRKNGKITCGRLYKPGKNPYSIPQKGEVAKIMKKYGFYQGNWGKDNVDFMHFSYFGV